MSVRFTPITDFDIDLFQIHLSGPKFITGEITDTNIRRDRVLLTEVVGSDLSTEYSLHQYYDCYTWDVENEAFMDFHLTFKTESGNKTDTVFGNSNIVFKIYGMCEC